MQPKGNFLRTCLAQSGRHRSCIATDDTTRSAVLSPALKKIVYSTKAGIFKWVSPPNLCMRSLSPPLLATCSELHNLQNFTVVTESDIFDSRNMTLFNNVKQNVHFIVTLIWHLCRKLYCIGSLHSPGISNPFFPCSSTHLMS